MKKSIIFTMLSTLLFKPLWALEINMENKGPAPAQKEIEYVKETIKTSKLDSSKLSLTYYKNSGCAEGTEISFIVVSKKDLTFLGNKVPLDTQFVFCGGDLSWMQLDDSHIFTVAGVNCRGQVEFYSADKFCECEIGADSNFKNIKLKKDSKLILDEKGQVLLYAPTTSYRDEKMKFDFESGKRYTLKNGKPILLPIPADPNDDRPYSCEITAGLSRDKRNADKQ